MRATQQYKPRRTWLKATSFILAIFTILSLIASAFLPFISG